MRTNSRCTEEVFGKFQEVSCIFYFTFIFAPFFFLADQSFPPKLPGLHYPTSQDCHPIFGAPRFYTSHKSRHFTLPLESGCRMFHPHMTLCSPTCCNVAPLGPGQAKRQGNMYPPACGAQNICMLCMLCDIRRCVPLTQPCRSAAQTSSSPHVFRFLPVTCSRSTVARDRSFHWRWLHFFEHVN
jgi:hypothetical protein